MRKLLYSLLALFFCGSFFYCKEPQKDIIKTVSGISKDTVAIHENLENRSETPSLALYRDTLLGIFDGKNKDLLISEPIPESYVPIQKMNDDYYDIYSGWFYKWRVYTHKGTVQEKIIENTVGISFVKEGDLDGDGKDEWGYICEWPTSNWMGYHIFKNYNGKWEYMIEPTDIWLGHIGDGDGEISPEQIIQKSNKKGFIKVKYSDVRNDGGDFLIIDTLIRVIKR